MVTAIQSGGSGDLSLTPIVSKPKTADSTDSFAQQLAGMITSYVNPSANGSRFEIDIEPAQGQDSGSRQFVVTVKDATNDSSGSEPADPIANLSAAVPASLTPGSVTGPPDLSLSALMPSPASAASAQALSGRPPAPANFTPTDAYWSTQPSAVQPLRDMPDDQRFAAAQELAHDGYKIDVPIMVWGWDPLVTMTVRQNLGFTWVPSALQPPVPVMPGLGFPGLPSYDAMNAPEGSIAVSTDFAKAANAPDPWMKS